MEDHGNHGKWSSSLYAAHWSLAEFKGRHSIAVLPMGASWIFGIWSQILVQEMHQRGIIPRNESIFPPISASLEETIADMATC